MLQKPRTFFSSIFEVVAGPWGFGHRVRVHRRAGWVRGSPGDLAGDRERVDIDVSCIISTILTFRDHYVGKKEALRLAGRRNRGMGF